MLLVGWPTTSNITLCDADALESDQFAHLMNKLAPTAIRQTGREKERVQMVGALNRKACPKWANQESGSCLLQDSDIENRAHSTYPYIVLAASTSSYPGSPLPFGLQKITPVYCSATLVAVYSSTIVGRLNDKQLVIEILSCLAGKHSRR